MVGCVRSMLMLVTIAAAKLPAWSTQIPLTDWAPAVSKTVGVDREPIPESASVQVNETVTLALFHPNEFAPGDLDPLMTGEVRSTLTLFSVTLAGLPARSTHDPVTDWPPASPRVVGDETLITPDRASEQAKLTVTGTLFQPFALG